MINEPDTDYREQRGRMADATWPGWPPRSSRPTGSIHTDADEFWWPIEGTLTETLAAIAERYGVVVAPRMRVRRDGPTAPARSPSA